MKGELRVLTNGCQVGFFQITGIVGDKGVQPDDIMAQAQ